MIYRIISKFSGTNKSIRLYTLFIKVVTLSLLISYTLVSIFRSASLIYNYGATSAIFNNLNTNDGTICIGKDWYRYSSSFLKPPLAQVEFIPSHFNGLLPGKFADDNKPSTWWNILSIIQADRADFNDLNQQELSHLVISLYMCCYD